MNGLIALVGAGEYLPVMNETDRYLLHSACPNGRTPRVACLATAAGREGDASVKHWLDMGVAHFRSLGADVTPVRIVDRDSANDPQWQTVLENADLIYFSGGNPQYLYETMRGSRAWHAAQNAWERGAVYAGCSAGAMILAERIPHFRAAGLKSMQAFQIIPATFIIPHFDRMRGIRLAYLSAARRHLNDGQIILGVDEDTALVGKLGGIWQVMGRGQAHLIACDGQQSVEAGRSMLLVAE
ncbi:MAG: Type 1 glutamine amidotransferase-like domain-containing protein [Anaerolineales bacterium]|nr:Type 1 glutamine amidotransferase-like domain-containing protein [Anaerolineales bacterium]